MKLIGLTQEMLATVDDKDFDWLSSWRWYAYKNRHTFYAARGETIGPGKQRMVKMHRAILGLEHGDKTQVDHINGNGLDNRRDNLRKATAQQNHFNRHRTPNTSGCKGVYWHKQDSRWIAQIEVNRRHIHIGSFTRRSDAIKARKKAEKHHFGEFA